jgi:hypothetical protein
MIRLLAERAAARLGVRRLQQARGSRISGMSAKATLVLLVVLIAPGACVAGDSGPGYPDRRTVEKQESQDPMQYNSLNGERRPEDNPGFNEQLREKQLQEQRSGPAQNPNINERQREKHLERERRGRGNRD